MATYVANNLAVPSMQQQRPINYFATDHWTAAGIPETIPITYIRMPLNSWRLASLMITYWQLIVITNLIVFSLEILIYILVCLILWFIAFGAFTLIHHYGGRCRRIVEFMRSPFAHLEAFTDKKILQIVSRIYSVTGKEVIWTLFWHLYFYLSFRRERMIQNYLAAWRQKYPNYSFVVFIDHDVHLKAPCSLSTGQDPMDDYDLIVHLNMFYRILRVQGSAIQVFLPKVRIRVDILDLLQNEYPGQHRSTLEVGYKYCRQMHHFKHPEVLTGSTFLSQKLRDENVIQDNDTDNFNNVAAVNTPASVKSPTARNNSPVMISRALAFVSGWDAFIASYIILTPTILSILICIIWPIIAVRKYHADVQTSIQTGATIASYIVTAGALLIALATWYDTLASVKLPEISEKGGGSVE